jgi:hypothetical protein
VQRHDLHLPRTDLILGVEATWELMWLIMKHYSLNSFSKEDLSLSEERNPSYQNKHNSISAMFWLQLVEAENPQNN